MAPIMHIGRAERLAPWITGVLFALPVLIAKYPPMTDLPLHEASVGLLRHWGDATFAPPSLYFVNLGHANQLYSLLALALAYVVPIGWATKMVVAGSLVALPVVVARFADHVGAPRWTALLVAPVGMGWLFFWGLVQNILGLVALFVALPPIDRFAARPTRRGALAICGLMVLLHFAHQAMQLVACAALVLCCLNTPLRAKPMLLRALPIAFCACLVYAANTYAWRLAGPRHLRTVPLVFYPLRHKLASIAGVLFGGYEPYVRNLMLILAAIPVLLSLVDRFRAAPEPGSRSLPARLHAWRFELLGIALFVVYLAAPANIKSTTLVYHRFLPPAWGLIAVCAAARTRAAARPLTRALCAVPPIATLLIAWPSFADSDRIYSALDEVIAHIEPGSAIMALNLGPDPPHRLWNPSVAEGHVVALRGGRSLFDYSQSNVSPVAQRPEKQWAEPVDRIELRPFHMRPAWDFTRFRYVLIATPRPMLATAVVLAFKDEATLIASKGDWYLFESQLPVVPIDADDAPLPSPHPSTLAKRLRDVARELGDAERAMGSDSPEEMR
jgi:hypothetical protein